MIKGVVQLGSRWTFPTPSFFFILVRGVGAEGQRTPGWLDAVWVGIYLGVRAATNKSGKQRRKVPKRFDFDAWLHWKKTVVY